MAEFPCSLLQSRGKMSESAPFFAVDGLVCMGCWIRAIALVGGLMGLLGCREQPWRLPTLAKLQLNRAVPW